jgi:hypothetical protein
MAVQQGAKSLILAFDDLGNLLQLDTSLDAFTLIT